MVELLSTKLYTSRVRKNLVSRPRLLERLNAGLDRKLTLIAAPAGFGKTTLLSEWIPQSPRCVTWFSLDEGDNDPTKFWAYFITSLQGLNPGLGEGALALLQSSQAPPITSILTALINEITAFPDAFAIVLDDYHVIESQPIHEALNFLVDHLPKNVHLVMTTRIDPPLPLARLRVYDELTEIRANDLRFTLGEIAEFLTQELGSSLSVEEVSALEARTEGWIAGLQIAALSMQGRDDVSGFVRAFSGSHRHILGYLADEVLNQRPAVILDFLLQTSILDRLCGSLCDAVTGGTNGKTTLVHLELANLFITPLDDEGVWYRYHPLFAEVLQARLKQIKDEQVLELHRRAGNWYANMGIIEEAVRYTLAGADYEEAARLIESEAGGMLRRGSSASLIHWLDALPEEMILARPRLCLARGWTFVWGPVFSLESADKWAQLALFKIAPGSLSERELEGEVCALGALIAADRVDLPLSWELSDRALEYLPADSPWRGVTTFCLGTTLYAAGKLSDALPVLTESLRLSQADGAQYTQLIAASFLADMQVFQGHLRRAMEMYQQVLAWSDHGIPQKGALVAHAGLANVLCERDQLEAAFAHVQSGIQQLEQVGGPGATLWLYRTLARIEQARGNWAGTLDALDQAYKSGQNAQIPFVMAQAEALRASLHLAQGNFDAAGQWAANCGLSPDDPGASQPGVREVEYLSLARVLAIQDRHTEALNLLDRLLRSTQAEGRDGSAIGILVMQALVHQTKGDDGRALSSLERALILAAPEGYVRVFLDEGEPMRRLLFEYQSTIKKQIGNRVDSESLSLLNFTVRLLAAFSQPAASENSMPETMHEPLSERELDILRLIASGHTNQEIAEILVIAVSTVKSHINNLYGKLGAARRTQAIAIARDLGLLAE